MIYLEYLLNTEDADDRRLSDAFIVPQKIMTKPNRQKTASNLIPKQTRILVKQRYPGAYNFLDPRIAPLTWPLRVLTTNHFDLFEILHRILDFRYPYKF